MWITAAGGARSEIPPGSSRVRNPPCCPCVLWRWPSAGASQCPRADRSRPAHEGACPWRGMSSGSPQEESSHATSNSGPHHRSHAPVGDGAGWDRDRRTPQWRLPRPEPSRGIGNNRDCLRTALTMVLTFTVDQRNAVRDSIVEHLSGIGDIRLLIERGDFTGARRLGEEYADDLRLLNDGLGWDAEVSSGVQVDLSAALLERTLSRHCHFALMIEASEIAERTDQARNQEASLFLVETCSRLLAEIKRRRC